MKKQLLVIIILICFCQAASAQMSFGHSFPNTNPYVTMSEIVELTRSGKKILVTPIHHSTTTPDTIRFYNPDYSFWKEIPCPAIPGYCPNNDINNPTSPLGFFYPSESLFNNDTFLEVAIFYEQLGSYMSGKLYIINENGTLTDSIVNASKFFRVQEASPGVFKAIVSTPGSIDIYDLPGTIPCTACGTGPGLAKTDNPDIIITKPIPNPSANQVKITFTLPEGESKGELQLFTSTGKKIQTYRVDNRFGFILLDNSQLQTGMYYYNIVVNGTVSSTQKMLVIK